MITVLLVDDHAVVRDGLAALIGNDGRLTVVGTAANGAEGASLADELQPDVILMDLSMPEVDGIEATTRIVAKRPGARVVILTSLSERERVNAALKAGAIGYVLKDAEPEEILRAVVDAAAGNSPISAKVAGALLPDRRGPALTAREHEVLALVAEGQANKAIARSLGISEKTVKAHLTRVFEAIDVSDRTQAALWFKSHS